MDNIRQIFARAGRVELTSCIKALRKLAKIEKPQMKEGLLRAVELLEQRRHTVVREAAPGRRRKRVAG